MKKKRISLLLAITLVGGTVLAACGNGDNSEQSADGVTTVEFWRLIRHSKHSGRRWPKNMKL